VVTLDFNNNVTDVEGTFSTADFSGDGQVWVLVDGPQCNDKNANGTPKSFNTVVPTDEDSGPSVPNAFHAGIDYCAGAPANITGSHTITLELHHNDGSPVTGGDGKTVSDSVKITVQLAPDDGGTDAGSDASGGG
jgi:hypothetical protein